MQPTFLLLIGFPGAGKLTISRALVRQLRAKSEKVCLVDSHLIVDPLFKVVGADGVTPLDPKVFSYATHIRQALMGAIEHFGIMDCHYLFTLFAAETEKENADEVVAEIGRVATVRGAHLRTVRLECDVDELVRRATTEERAHRPKLVNEAKIRELHERHQVYAPTLGHPLTIDVTELSAEMSAQRILTEVFS